MNDEELEVDLARIEAANWAHGVRVFAGCAIGCLVIAAVALLLDWQTEVHDTGVAARMGYDAAPVIVLVTGALALVLLAVGYRQVEQHNWTSWAAVLCAGALWGCIISLSGAGDDDVFTGPAGWIALIAFGAAIVLAVLASVQSRTSTWRPPPYGVDDAEKRLRTMLDDDGRSS